jgi:hypothetical protein
MYCIALLNTRGHLTEYCKELMIEAKRSGAHVVMISDYEYEGIKIASETPMEIPWIGVNDFQLDRESVEIDAENQRSRNYVEQLVKYGRHPPDQDLRERVGRTDKRFLNKVDLEFLGRWKRVEINAVLAEVESERFFEYITS